MALKQHMADEGWRALLRGSALTLLLRGIGGLLELGLGIAVARTLGLGGTGAYMAGLTLAAALTTVSRLGLDNALLRLVAADSALQQWDRAASAARRGLAAAAATALVATLLVQLALLLAVPADALLHHALAGLALSILPMSLAYLYGELLKAVGRYAQAQFVSAVLPFLSAVLLMLGPLRSAGLAGMVAAYVCGAGMAALCGAWLWHRGSIAAHAAGGGASVSWRELLAGSPSLLSVKLLRLSAPWMATAALGIWAGTADLAVYGVAQRISVVVALLLIAVNAVAGRQFAIAIRNGDEAQLKRTVQRATRLACLFGGPLVLALIAVPDWIMRCYGAAFAGEGASVMRVLALGQAVNVLTGPVNYLLLIGGEEQQLLRAVLLSTLLAGVLLLLLVPTQGALGAATATAAAMLVQNLGSAWLVWRRYGIVTMPGTGRCLGRRSAVA